MANVREQLQTTLGGSYTLERELGGGGMSRVFVAEETRLGRKVVVKVLSPELAAGLSAGRFEREIRLAASLQQANIVPVLSAGETGGLPFYTMPFVEGESLRARLGRNGALSITEAVGILRDVARALVFAHEHGVVHRDIKPDNVLLSGGTAVVTDFGIAKALAASATKPSGATLTQIGTSIGTPAYMAPEQAAGDPETDHRADIYAFGCMAYELLAAQPPFAGRTPQRMLAAHIGERPQPIDELRPDTPSALAALVMRCLEKDAHARPQSAADLVRVLDSVTSGGPLPAMPPILLGGPGMLRKALFLYAAAFVGVAVVAKAAIVALGLPDWVFPGALVVMALGLPVILFTGYVHHATHRALTRTPALTPGGTPAPQSTMATLALKASPHVSWRRTATGGLVALAVFALLVAGFMASRALGIGPAASLLAAGKLGERPRVLVADFGVRGADSSLGDVVSEAVRTDLGQSSAVSVVPASAVATALQLMQRSPTTPLDLPLARGVALREGVGAVVHGDVTSLGSGSGYLITLRLVAAESGDELTSYREAIEHPRELLAAVGTLTRRLRGKIGESLKTVRASVPLDAVTTSSLEALRKYVAGSRAHDLEANYPKAIALLQEAVAIDTGFAMAYRKLGAAYGNTRMAAASDSAFGMAFRHRHRLTERERLLTEASYYRTRGNDRQKAVAAYEALAEKSIDDLHRFAANNFALVLNSRREFARAEAVLRRAMNESHSTVQRFGQLGVALFNQGKLAAFESSLVAARQQFPNAPEAGLWGLSLAYHRGHLDSVSASLADVRRRGSTQARATASFQLANLELVRGRPHGALRLLAEARAMESARGVPPRPFDDSLFSALVDVWFREDAAAAMRKVEATLADPMLRALRFEDRPYLMAATVYARAREPGRARAVVRQYDAEMRDSSFRRAQQPLRRQVLAEIALAERRPLDAVREFSLGDMLPDGPVDACIICLPGALGRAYDLAGMPDSAIVMFERYAHTPDIMRLQPRNDPLLLAGIRKRLGELYEEKGDHARAVVNYAKFVELWKDADPELQPKVAEVHRRLARLRAAQPR